MSAEISSFTTLAATLAAKKKNKNVDQKPIAKKAAAKKVAAKKPAAQKSPAKSERSDVSSFSGLTNTLSAKKSGPVRKDLDVALVNNKEDLRTAIESHKENIQVVGEFADKLYKTRKIAKLSTVTLAALTTAIAAIPFTGGGSAIGLVPIATLTGMEISLIVIAVAIGIVLILAVFKEYDVIEYSEGRLVLRRKQG